MAGDATMPDVRALARARLADSMCRDLDGDGDKPCAHCIERAEVVLSSPDVEVGPAVVDLDLTGRHSAVVVWLPLRLSGPAVPGETS